METKQISYSTPKPNDLRELMEFSFRVIPGSKSFTPILTRATDIEDIWSHGQLAMKYSIHNDVWAFIIDNAEYVVPYFIGLGSILKNAGFQRTSFHVPFSNSDYPVSEYDKWAEVQEAVRKWNISDAREKCRCFSKSSGISPLPQKLLAIANEIPFDGLIVRNSKGHKIIEFPNLHSDKVSEAVLAKLGTFSYKNDVFIVHSDDGRSYSISNVKKRIVIRSLLRNGYREAQLHVPFADNEQIVVLK